MQLINLSLFIQSSSYIQYTYIVTCVHRADLQVVSGAGVGGVSALSLQQVLVATDQLRILAVGLLQEGGRDALRELVLEC